MPNNVSNYLMVNGFDLVGLYGGAANADDTPDFNKIIPCPPHVFMGSPIEGGNGELRGLTARDEEKYGKHNCWYQWNVNNWGTKWNAYSCALKRHKETDVHYFETAWAIPYKIYEALSMLHKDAEICFVSRDEGDDRIYAAFYRDGLVEKKCLGETIYLMDEDENGKELEEGRLMVDVPGMSSMEWGDEAAMMLLSAYYEKHKNKG